MIALRGLTPALLITALAACTSKPAEQHRASPVPTDSLGPISESTVPSSGTLAATMAPPTQLPEVSPTPACKEPSGRIERASYSGVALAEEVPYQIYLPPCYDEGGEELASLYLLHGYPFDEKQWIELGAIDTAERMILRGDRAPFLVVLPRQPEPLFRSTDGGPGSYEQEFLEGLLPAVERSYRARAGPSRRALAGLSRGGVWALEIGLRNPEMFDSVGAMSPALAVNYAREPYDPYHLASQVEPLPGRIALVAGEQDWAASGTARLSGILTSRAFQHLWLELPGGHEDGLWRSGMEAFIGYLTQGWAIQE